MLRDKLLLLLLALCMMIVISSCGQQASSGLTDLIPIACHKELGVGMLFITVENRGDDARPSMMVVAYKILSSAKPHVQLEVQTPEVSAGTERLIMVDLPTLGTAGGFLQPVGKITIILDAQRVLPEANRANNILITDCSDRI